MSVPRRVLVAARHLALDRTSEGLCTSRFVQALVDSGHEVRCLTTDPSGAVPAGAGADVEVVRISEVGSRPRAMLAAAADPARAEHPTGRRVRSAAALATTVGTGLTPTSWSEVSAWRRGIDRQRHAFAPDVVVVRGGGLGFEPHLAMADGRRDGPWIAHFHDPYPLSAYPPSYAHHTPVISGREERACRRILRRATIVTFTSDRLADWTQRSSGVELTGRRGVLVNIGGDINDDRADTALIDRLCGTHRFVLVHTGTLLRQRSPLPLLRAFRRLVATGDEQAAQSRLVLLGSLDRSHRADGELGALRAELEATGNLRVEDRRTDHATAFALARRATAVVLIEADDPESPFFPAKLADYLVADRPVVALSPARSAARDLLGAHDPLACAPGDEDAIAAALTTLWTAWRADRLDALRPPARARLEVSADHAAAAARVVVDQALRRHEGRRPARTHRQVGSPS